MFRAHQSCRATRRVRRKIARKSLCEPFGKRFRQGRAKTSSRALSEASWRANLAPRTANLAAKTANLAAKTAQLAVLRPFQTHARAALSRQDRAKSASERFWFDFGLSGDAPGPSQERSGSDFAMIFVFPVRSFVRPFFCCFVVCWFVLSLVRVRSSVPSFVCRRAFVRAFFRSFSLTWSLTHVAYTMSRRDLYSLRTLS